MNGKRRYSHIIKNNKNIQSIIVVHQKMQEKNQSRIDIIKKNTKTQFVASIGCSWAALGHSWAARGRSCAALGRSWAALGPLLERHAKFIQKSMPKITDLDSKNVPKWHPNRSKKRSTSMQKTNQRNNPNKKNISSSKWQKLLKAAVENQQSKNHRCDCLIDFSSKTFQRHGRRARHDDDNADEDDFYRAHPCTIIIVL